MCVVFFFQAEDGIRDRLVTGVQTCALPIFYDHEGDPNEMRNLATDPASGPILEKLSLALRSGWVGALPQDGK